MITWDTRYSGETFVFGTAPNDFLRETSHYLPPRSRVVSLGEGEGRNAVYLAQQGHFVTAIDGSAVGLEKAGLLAERFGVSIRAVVGDLGDVEILPCDVIVSIFCHVPSALRRDMYRRALTALFPGGIAIIESYHPGQLGRGTGGPSDPDMLVRLADLMADWSGCELIEGQEIVRDVQEGRLHTGQASVTQAVFRKPRTERL